MSAEHDSASAEKLKVITINIPEGVISALDRLAATKNFRDPSVRASRSSMIREAIVTHYGWKNR
jgi:metal-responsive CopG/Arc/MetJ family transcriptional regulator